jgi:hypothetical protein
MVASGRLEASGSLERPVRRHKQRNSVVTLRAFEGGIVEFVPMILDRLYSGHFPAHFCSMSQKHRFLFPVGDVLIMSENSTQSPGVVCLSKIFKTLQLLRHKVLQRFSGTPGDDFVFG